MHLRVDTDSLTHFRDRTSELLGRLKETGSPLVLTVDGKAEVVVQDAGAYQRLLDRAEHLETIAALKVAIQAVDAGRTRPAEEATVAVVRASAAAGGVAIDSRAATA